MNRKCKIKPLQEFEHVNFYSVHMDGEAHCEFSKFLLKFENDSKFKKDFGILIAWLNEISKDKALERRFRPEKRARAIPIPSCKLRLYCYRVSDNILILGGGGHKTEKKAQDCPNVSPIFEEINKVATIIDQRLKTKKIKHTGKILSGDLEFTI